jgi:hypothetical protein
MAPEAGGRKASRILLFHSVAVLLGILPAARRSKAPNSPTESALTIGGVPERLDHVNCAVVSLSSAIARRSVVLLARRITLEARFG